MLNFIANPAAGAEKGKKILKTISSLRKILNEKNVEYVFHYTEKKGHATTITKDLIAKGVDNVIVVGGDGTLHEVINGFSDFDRVSLGIIPCGTGNDFASALNLPSNPEEALELILHNEPKYTDFMQMPTVRGLNIIGAGIDVDVLRRYNKLKRKTKLGYTTSLVKSLLNFKYIQFDAITPEEKCNYNSFIACIANGYRYGGGIEICPSADPTDNSLDFVAVLAMPKIKLISAFLKLKKGKADKIKGFVHKPCTEIKIDLPKPYTVNVDGELYEDIPFEIKIVSNTLKVFR